LWRKVLREGIFRGIREICGLVVADVCHAKETQHIVDGAAVVAEGHGAVMREALLDEHMAVEAAHFGDGEDADAAEGIRSGGQDLALGDIGPEAPLAGALKAEEGDVTVSNVTLQSATGEVGGAAVFQQAVLDELVLHAALLQLAKGSVAAVEAHEGVSELVLASGGNAFLIEVFRHGIVDIQQSHRIAADAEADVLAEGAVDIHFTGYRNAPAHHAAVHIAGLKAEFLGESGPALVSKSHVLIQRRHHRLRPHGSPAGAKCQHRPDPGQPQSAGPPAAAGGLQGPHGKSPGLSPLRHSGEQR